VQRSGLRKCGTVAGSPMEGTPLLRCFPSGTLYNLAQVQSGAGLTARLPEQSQGIALPPLTGGGTWEVPRKGHEFPLPGTGTMGVQIPPAGAMDTLKKRRDTNTPAPELCSFARFG